jgi:polysaccharide pyruvyl transferase CsaB
MKKKVLIAGWVGSENTGDEAILESVRGALATLDVEVRAFSVNEASTRKWHGIETAPFDIYQGPVRFIRAIRWCDVMLVGGGGILQDQTSIFNTPRYLYKAALAKMFRKKVVFYAVGAGPVQYGLTKVLLRLVLNWADGITVRDVQSKQILTRLGIRPELIEVTFDPVISLEPKGSSKGLLAAEIPNLAGKKVIGVCLRHWYDTHPFLPVSVAQKLHFKQKDGADRYQLFVREVAQAIDQLNATGKYAFLFIPYWYSRDAAVHDDVISMLKNKDNLHRLSKPYRPAELLSIFADLDMVLAMRLHACIYAAAVQTPFVALSYTSKVDNFLSEIDASEQAIPIDSVNAGIIVDKVNHIVQAESNLRKGRANQAIRAARDKESKNLAMVRSVLEAHE